MAQAAGLDSEFDAELYHALRNSRGTSISLDTTGPHWKFHLGFYSEDNELSRKQLDYMFHNYCQIPVR